MTNALDLLTALRRFGLENDRFDFAVARAHGMSLAEMRALDHIQAEGELTPREIALRLGLTSGAVTAVIDRLEKADWVVRVPHPSDRRSVVVRMTSKAEEAGERIYVPFSESLQRAAAELPEEQRTALTLFLDEAARLAAEHAREWTGSGPAPTA